MTSANRLILLLLPLSLAVAGCNGDAGPGDTGNPPGTGGSPPSDPAPSDPGPSDPAPSDPSPSDPAPSDPPRDDDGSDKRSPQVVDTTPADNSSHVGATASITVTFDEPVDPASAGDDAVHLTGPAGSVDFDLAVVENLLIIDPLATLEDGSYTVTLDASVTDLAGNPLPGSHSWQFTVDPSLCADFYQPGFQLVQGKDTTRMSSSLPKPAKGVPYRDPAYGTCVVRVADHDAEGLSTQSRNYYSRIQPFNADDSYVLVHSLDGTWHVYDPHTTRHLKKLSLGGGSVEPQWHPTDPKTLFVFPNRGGMTISTVNVDTLEKRTVADFRSVKSIHGHPGKTSILQVWSTAARLWTHWEGSPSADARYWGLMVETSGGSPLGMITYDLQENAITGVFDYASDGNGIDAPDHISMSPSGDYVVPAWNGSGENCASRSELGTTNRPCGLMSYTRDFSHGVGLTVRGPHSDIGIDANGRDVIVAGDYDSGWVEMWDLGSGQGTRLWQIYENGNSTAMHISAKNFDKPGWVLVSTYMEKQPGWYVNKLFAVEMKANPRILNIAHTYNTVESYFSETHAAVNRDFTRVLYNSNWNTANYDNTDAYMVVLPPGSVPAN